MSKGNVVTLIFFVPGEPIPKQSFRYGSGRGRSRISQRVLDWQETIGMHAMAARQQSGGMTIFHELMGRRVTLSLHFYRSKMARCDIDNLTKAALDGLKGVVFNDDRQVRVVHAFMHNLSDPEEDPYADQEIQQPGVEVSVTYWHPKSTIQDAAHVAGSVE